MKLTAGVLLTMTAGVLFMAGSNAGMNQADRKEAQVSLIDAERAFSRLSETKGIREAFLSYLAPDAVVFRPGPVAGRPVYETMDPANPTVLTWAPEVAEVSASGELGYTSGPYQVRPGRGLEPTAFGHYVSVWKKQADGTWKVLLDIGIQHGRPASLDPVETVVTPAAEDAGRLLSPEALREEERVFGPRAGSIDTNAAAKGLRKALSDLATDDIRVYRPGRFPAIGKRSFKDLIPANDGRMPASSKRRSTAYQVGLAWSGDLAYSYGTSESGKGGGKDDTTAYLRIWRKGTSGIWKICLDIELPVPPD